MTGKNLEVVASSAMEIGEEANIILELTNPGHRTSVSSLPVVRDCLNLIRGWVDSIERAMGTEVRVRPGPTKAKARVRPGIKSTKATKATPLPKQPSRRKR